MDQAYGFVISKCSVPPALGFCLTFMQWVKTHRYRMDQAYGFVLIASNLGNSIRYGMGYQSHRLGTWRCDGF